MTPAGCPLTPKQTLVGGLGAGSLFASIWEAEVKE